MMESGEEIIEDLDATLDQLIVNAKAMIKIGKSPLFNCEAEALEKTQESLLARLFYRQKILKERKREELCGRASRRAAGGHKKLARFNKLTLSRKSTQN